MAGLHIQRLTTGREALVRRFEELRVEQVVIVTQETRVSGYEKEQGVRC